MMDGGRFETRMASVWIPIRLEEWAHLVDQMAIRILWDDCDYEECDLFLDADPELRRAAKRQLRIPEDYYAAIAPDPTEIELAMIPGTPRSLCR
jgi:hypothetical protein